MHLKTSLLTSLLFIGFIIGMYSCTKDEALAPAPFNLANCDTPSFSTVIQPLIAQSCATAGCHGSGASSGGYNFENHSAFTSQGTQNALLAAIKHDAGFSPMPQGGPKMSDSTIYKIECWILGGAPNN